MAVFLCRSCQSRLLLIASVNKSAWPLGGGRLLLLLRPSRRGMKATTKRTPLRQSLADQLAQQAGSTLSTEPLKLSPIEQAWQLVGRLALTAASGGLLILLVRERRRNRLTASTIDRFDFGYVGVDNQPDNEADKLLDDLFVLLPTVLYCGFAVATYFRLTSRTLSIDKLVKLSRHLFDQPGRSAILTAPWVSSFSAIRYSQFALGALSIAVLSSVNFGYSPVEKILAYITGSLAGSTFRCAYQQLLLLTAAKADKRTLGHFIGPYAGLTTLLFLMVLSLRSASIEARTQQGNLNLPRSIQRNLQEEVNPSACTGLAVGWFAYNLFIMTRYRRWRPTKPGPPSPALTSVSSLAGLVAACGIHAAVHRPMASE